MILSFPYLVVILTTLGTPKNIFCINNNIMNDNSKQNKTTRARTSLVVLYLRNYAAGIHGHYHESSDHFEYPKKSILKSSHPKKYLPNLHTQKNPGIENFKPKKILRSSPSLEVRSTPPGSDLLSLLRRGLLQSRWVETRGGWEEGKIKARGERSRFFLQCSRFPLFSFTGVY